MASDLFWELDAALMVVACATRLRRLAGLAPSSSEDLAAVIAATCGHLCTAARERTELQGVAALVERIALS